MKRFNKELVRFIRFKTLQMTMLGKVISPKMNKAIILTLAIVLGLLTTGILSEGEETTAPPPAPAEGDAAIAEASPEAHGALSNNESSSNTSVCEGLTIDSDWEDQKPIHACHLVNFTHPRLIPRKRRTEQEMEWFHSLALFNIKYDLDFQEAGDKCSTKLQKEWVDVGNNGTPVRLSEFSFNRIWYKRLCNFFSYLECIPRSELRTKSKSELIDLTVHADDDTVQTTTEEEEEDLHASHKHPGALPDKHPHLLAEFEIPNKTKAEQENDNATSTMKNIDDGLIEEQRDYEKEQAAKNISTKDIKYRPRLKYSDSNKNTYGLERLIIGGRGPGKSRHKSGPGGNRVDVKSLGASTAYPAADYPLDGICACSTYDPEYSNRTRPDYGMDFVEDEMRPKWCVAAPGNLCGRVYFRAGIWPGQRFEMSDHIGCPRLYQGVEYECVRWQLVSNKDEDENFKKPPNTRTSTCEKKMEDEDLKKKQMMERAQKEADAAASFSHFNFYQLAITYISCFLLSRFLTNTS